MSTNYTSNAPQFPEKKDNRNLIYGILIALLIGTWIYIFYDKNKSTTTITNLETQISNIDSARNALQKEYDLAIAKMDSISANNTQLEGALSARNAEIQKLKGNIASILKNKNATAAELATAKQMISDLNGQIETLYAEIEKLKKENEALTADNQQLNKEKTTLQEDLHTTQTEKKKLEETVDVASTLHASNFNIVAINLKNSGKEKTTTTAKRADFFRVFFDIDENRVAPSGSKELYVTITGPDGKPYSSGSFTTREGVVKAFTNKVIVNYEQGKRIPVSFDWKTDKGDFATGEYTIEIYHNGFKIGQAVKSLKKGGLFS